jgi:hypothetical protein
LAIQSSGFGGRIYNTYQAAQDEMTRNGNLLGSARLESGVQSMSGVYNRLSQYVDSATLSQEGAYRLYDLASTLPPEELNQAQAILSGDIYAASNAYQRTRASGQQNGLGQGMYNLVDTETGLNPYQMNISADEANTLHQFDYAGYLRGQNLEGLSPIQMQREMKQIQYQQADRQYEIGRSSSIAQYSAQFGGEMILKPLEGVTSEFANQLKGLSGGLEATAEQFRKFGFDFDKGDGRGYRQLEDDQLAISRAAAQRGFAQQEASIGLNEQSMQLRWNQFFENLGFSKEKFGYQTGRQSEDMALDRGMQLKQRTWQAEDMSFQRSKSEIGFGWQMEDFDLGLRYARGMDRRKMLREQERAVISQAMERGKMDRDESRFDEKNAYDDEKFRRAMQDFNKSIEFQQRAFEMQERHFREQYAIDLQQFELSKQRFEQEKADQQALWAIEDQRRLLDRQFQEAQTAQQMQLSQEAQENTVRLRQMGDILTGIGEAYTNQRAKFDATRNSLQGLQDVYTTMGKTLKENSDAAIKTAAENVNTLITNNTKMASSAQSNVASIFSTLNSSIAATLSYLNSLKSATGATVDPIKESKSGFLTSKANGGSIESVAAKIIPFNRGGYTGDGFKQESAGVDLLELHKGEYVVPQNGALVLRGSDNMSSEELREIRRLLQRLVDMGIYSVNAQIYTNDKSMKTSDLNPYDAVFQSA